MNEGKRGFFDLGGRMLLASALALSLALGGCSGDDGRDGAPGAAGAPGGVVTDVTKQTPEALAAMTFTGEVTGVTINSPPVVNFKVADNNGRGVVGLTASNLRFIIAKLVPGTGGSPDTWQSYINTTEEPATKLSGGQNNNVGPGGTPKLAKATQATTESNGTLVDNGDGTYTYTFATDVTAVKDPVTGAAIAYNPALTHRLAIQLSGGSLPVANIIYDFIPAGGEVSTKREIAATVSCNECHDKLAIHGSGRIEVKYCVTCHNPGTVDANSGNSLDMAEMIHKIHRGKNLPSVEAGGEYAIWGYRASKLDFSEVGYPQDIKNCRKCHTGADSATPQGDNWKLKPSIQACGSCHDNVNFATGANHAEGAQDNSTCMGCHGPGTEADVEQAHLTNYATSNNPDVPAGAANFTYEIISVSTTNVVQGSTTNVLPVVTFRILRDGAPLDVVTLPSDLTGGPSFMVAYASTQDGLTAPADWNQKGKSQGQPVTVSLANLRSGAQGSISGSGGNYTATLKGTLTGEVWSAAFPADATMRAVALQGYFTQTGIGGRYTPSVIKEVTNDPKRRTVVDNNKCLACHETLQLHGGNRVDNIAVCVVCHNPNLSSSGRGANLSTYVTGTNADTDATIAALGSDPLTYPEAAQNLKELVHGIHGSGKREFAFEFVRDRQTNGVFYFDWSEVTYPGILKNCKACHNDGTYEVPLTANVLMTTDKTTTGNPAETRTDISTVRASVPNTTDLVNTPIASACYYCHDTTLAVAHMEQNGGRIKKARSSVDSTEACAICHAPGKSADVKVVHGVK